MAKDYVHDAARVAGERSQPDAHTYFVEVHQAGETVLSERVTACSAEAAMIVMRNRIAKMPGVPTPYEIQVSRRFKIVPKVVHSIETEEVT